MFGTVHDGTREALAVRAAALGEATYPPSPGALVANLIGPEYFRPPPGHPMTVILDPPLFAPMKPLANLPVPALATPGELADWSLLSSAQLNWLVD